MLVPGIEPKPDKVGTADKFKHRKVSLEKILTGEICISLYMCYSHKSEIDSISLMSWVGFS